MFTALYLLTAAACWSAAAYRLRALGRGGTSPAGAALAAALAGSGLVMVLQVGQVAAAVDRVTAIPGTAQALGHAVGLCCGLAAQLVLVYVVTSSVALAHRRARRRALIMGTIIAGMAGIFLFAPDAPLRDRLLQPTGSGIAYALLFTVSLGIAGADVARLAWWGGRVTERPYLRLGLRLVAAAGLLTVGYAIVKNVFVALRLAGSDPPAVEHALVGSLIVGAALLFAVGATLPAWGPRLGLNRPVRWLTYYQDHRGLRPLWLDLYRVEPLICLDDKPSTSFWTDLATVRDLKSRVYRRVIEIRDGLLLLRPWLDPAVRDTARRTGVAAGLDGDGLAVVTEACVVAAALAARRAGVAPVEPPRLRLTTHADIDTETRWLCQVAAAYRSSFLVRAMRAGARGGAAAARDVETGTPA